MKHWSNWIVADPKVMMGKPVISGTRITVELILEKLMTSLPPVAACGCTPLNNSQGVNNE
jgi:hypothetical protein